MHNLITFSIVFTQKNGGNRLNLGVKNTPSNLRLKGKNFLESLTSLQKYENICDTFRPCWISNQQGARGKIFVTYDLFDIKLRKNV